jgi:hypothetical protein
MSRVAENVAQDAAALIQRREICHEALEELDFPPEKSAP